MTPDHEDPEYTDVCYEITREVCDYCCLIDFEFCSRDIGICEPVEDRNLVLILHCVIVFLGINCGFPIITAFCNCFISQRCCPSLYPRTAGVSCYELLMRTCCFLFCCVRFDQTFDVDVEGDGEGGKNEKRGVWYYLFCCCLCPCLFKNKGSEQQAAANEGEEGEGNEPEDYEAVEGKDDGEGSDAGGG